jgi:hypothetical protein
MKIGEPGRGEGGGNLCSETLLPDAEPLDDALVSGEVTTLDVVEHATPLSDELEQPTTGMVILFVNLEVLGEVHDPVCQKRDLHFRGTSIGVVLTVRLHDLFGTLKEHCHPALSVYPFFSRFGLSAGV